MYDPSIVEAQKQYRFFNLHYAKFAGPYPLVRNIEIDLPIIDADNEVLSGEILIDFTSDATNQQREAVLAELKKEADFVPVLFDGDITITAVSGLVSYDMVKKALGALLTTAMIKTDDVTAAFQFLTVERPYL